MPIDTKALTVRHDAKTGWSVIWVSGFQSAMPNEKAARLVSAAPDLLDNLKDLVRCIRDFELGDFSPLMDEIFESEGAIAKAEGRDEP